MEQECEGRGMYDGEVYEEEEEVGETERRNGRVGG